MFVPKCIEGRKEGKGPMKSSLVTMSECLLPDTRVNPSGDFSIVSTIGHLLTTALPRSAEG